MEINSIQQMSDSIKILKNSNDVCLPSKPKILSNKKSQKQKIAELLVKSSPLKLQKINENKKDCKVKKEISQIIEGEISKNQEKLQNSDSLISSENTSGLFYDQINRSQSTMNLHVIKDSLLSEAQKSIDNQSRQKSRSKLIRKQNITKSSKISQTKNNNLSSTSPQFMMQNRFYHYCAQQIIKLSQQTDQIKNRIANRHIQTTKIKQMNLKLEQKIQKQRKEIEEYENFREQIDKERKSLQQQVDSYQKQVFQNLPQKYKTQYRRNHEQQQKQIRAKMERIKKQQEAIQLLRLQLNHYKEQEQKKKDLINQNVILKEQIQKVRRKRLEYDRKVLKKNYVIKHLQEIKMVEYDNLLKAFV